MKVAINGWFLASQNVGTGQYIRQLLLQLPEVAPDIEVVIVLPRIVQDILQRERMKFQYQIIGIKTEMTAIGKFIFEQFHFPRVCREINADLAHIPYWGSPFVSLVPTVVTVLDLIPIILPEYRGGLFKRFYYYLMKKSSKSISAIITISNSSKKDINTHLGILFENIKVVYLAPNDKCSPNGNIQADQNVRNKYLLPKKYVLYLGGFDVRKNVDMLLHMYFENRETFGPKMPLVVAGKLPSGHFGYYRDPRIISHELKADNLFQFIGFVEENDKSALFRMASAFIYPSRYEGFGLPPLEAMDCGVPVVVANSPGVAEVVGDAAMLYNPDDRSAMFSALWRVLNNSDLSSLLKKKGLLRARQFSWQRCAYETSKIYHEACNRRHLA